MNIFARYNTADYAIAIFRTNRSGARICEQIEHLSSTHQDRRTRFFANITVPLSVGRLQGGTNAGKEIIFSERDRTYTMNLPFTMDVAYLTFSFFPKSLSNLIGTINGFGG